MVPCVSATCCCSRAVGSRLQWRVLVGVCLWGRLLCVPVSRSPSRCSLGVSRCRLGVEEWGIVGPSSVVYPSSFRPHVLPLPYLCGPCPVMLPVLVALRMFLATVLCCLQCPVHVGACPLPGAFPRPLAAALPLALALLDALVVGWWRGLCGAARPCPGVGCLEPSAEGFGGVGAAEALNRVPKEAFPCSLRYGGLMGVLLWVDGAAGINFFEYVDNVHPLAPFRSSGPLHPAAELLQSGG